MTIPKIESNLLNALKQGSVVITPNNRLSNQLLQDFLVHSGQDVIAKPKCLPWQAFLNELYMAIRHNFPTIDHPVLLSPIQQYHLWCKILTPSELSIDEGLLHEVQSAWTNCCLWQVDLNDPAFKETPLTRQFQRWHNEFSHQLIKHNAMTLEQAVNYILLFLDAVPYPEIVWACFNEFTPQQIALQKAFCSMGCRQKTYDWDKTPESSVTFPAENNHEEQLQMLEWVKARLGAGDKRIGVVVPELQTQSKKLQRLIERHLPMNSFNISLGEPLSVHPLIAHALVWLNLDKQIITNDTARLLLQSPYLSGSKSEFRVRSEAVQSSKWLKEVEIPLSLWIQELNGLAPELARSLGALKTYPAEGSPQMWGEQFKKRLIDLGFPGDYALNSECYQYFQRLEALFEEFLQLTTVNTVLSQTQALHYLNYLAKSTIFQTRKPTTPVWFLGLLEASGCDFDSVWITGMDDHCLPQKTKLSAFIPHQLQRNLNMPKALPEKELHFARLTIERLQKGSRRSVFSYSRLIGDTPNLPSPLIRELPLHQPLPLAAQEQYRLQPREEIYSLPIEGDEPVTGGTALLGDQAKCPFRAFARHRLHAKPMQAITAGPDASERGQIVHKIMETLWQHLMDRQTLLSLPKVELDARINEAITESITRHTNFRTTSFPELMKAVESTRLKTLIESCLEWERQRPDFTVEAIEQQFNIELAGLEFKVRVDRLDKVGNQKWVIDYKTTMPANKPWDSERPEDPQLLLYALLDKEINALLFLQLKAGKLTVGGLSEETTELDGIKSLKKNEYWEQLQTTWREQLTNLAAEFRQGHCLPEPKRAGICQQCDYPSLCRINI